MFRQFFLKNANLIFSFLYFLTMSWTFEWDLEWKLIWMDVISILKNDKNYEIFNLQNQNVSHVPQLHTRSTTVSC